MKKILLIAITFFTINAIAQEKKTETATIRKDLRVEQQNRSPEKIADATTSKLTKQLELTEDQQKKVHALILEHTKQNYKNRDKSKGMVASNKKAPKTELIERKRVQIDEINNKLKDILTLEQYEKYEIMTHKKQSTRQKASIKKD